jgi:hypothetical protein
MRNGLEDVDEMLICIMIVKDLITNIHAEGTGHRAVLRRG